MWLAFFISVAMGGETQEKSAFEQIMEQNAQVSTQERWIEINGIRYREVVYDGRSFFLRLKGREQEHAELDCQLVNPNQPHLVEVGVKVFKRSKMFVQLLQETCEHKKGQNKVTLTIDPRFGFTLPEDSNSSIQNKKIYLNPLIPSSGIGFSGEW